jgi:hypothetical protein
MPVNNIYSKNLIQGCNRLSKNYFIEKSERVDKTLSDRHDTHILGHYFFDKTY